MLLVSVLCCNSSYSGGCGARPPLPQNSTRPTQQILPRSGLPRALARGWRRNWAIPRIRGRQGVGRVKGQFSRSLELEFQCTAFSFMHGSTTQDIAPGHPIGAAGVHDTRRHARMPKPCFQQALQLREALECAAQSRCVPPSSNAVAAPMHTISWPTAHSTALLATHQHSCNKPPAVGAVQPALPPCVLN